MKEIKQEIKQEYLNKLQSWRNDLSKICEGIDFRNKGNYFIEGPYIVGYDGNNDISFRIEFCPEKTIGKYYYPSGFLFHIEWKGHDRLNRRITIEDCDEGFISYKYILEDMINFENKLSKKISDFPKLTTQDNRDKKINEIISEIYKEI